jgi:hypothetical protein
VSIHCTHHYRLQRRDQLQEEAFSIMDSTIIDLKKSFLQSQVRNLNSPLKPAPDWRDTGLIVEQGELNERVVQEAVNKGYC